jgi:hypothetical protein
MAITTSQNALSTAAEIIFAANSGVTYREVTNTDASISVYLGNSSSVTSSNGHLLAAGKSFGFDGPAAKLAIYAIAASGTPTVTLVEW